VIAEEMERAEAERKKEAANLKNRFLRFLKK
jgi:hypothetical protein